MLFAEILRPPPGAAVGFGCQAPRLVAGDPTSGGSTALRDMGGMTRTKRRIFAIGLGLAALAATLLVGASAATADPSISSKREQAQAILAQIREMDSEPRTRSRRTTSRTSSWTRSTPTSTRTAGT